MIDNVNKTFNICVNMIETDELESIESQFLNNIYCETEGKQLYRYLP